MTRLRSFLIRDTYGGVNKEWAEHILPDNAATRMDNFVLRAKGAETAKGWETFTSQILTTGTGTPTALSTYRIDQYFKDDGSSYLVAFTDKRAYYFYETNDLWLPITQGGTPTTTTLTGAHAAGLTQLTVASSTGFANGEEIIVGLGTSNVEYMIVNGAPPDATHINVTRPSWVTAGTGLVRTHAGAERVDDISTMVFGSDASQFDTENTDNTFYFTDGVNTIQTWTATGTPTFSATLGGTTTGSTVEGLGAITANLLAKYMRAFEGFMVLGFLNENGVTQTQKVRWSRYGSFTNWGNNADGTGQAGWFDFDSPDWIMGLYQLKRELLVYRERSIEAMSYIGAPDTFAIRRAETGTGLLSPTALVDLGDTHIFAGPDDFYSYNGISLSPIGDSVVTRSFFDTLDPSQRTGVIAFYIEEEFEVWFCYSTTGNRVCDKAIVYSTKFNKWSGPRDVDATGLGYYELQSSETWDDVSATWSELSDIWDSRTSLANAPISLMGNNDGLIFITNTGETENGTTYTRTYETKLLDFGDPEGTKRVQRVRIGFEEYPSTTVNVYLGKAKHEGDDLEWTSAYALPLVGDSDAFAYFDETDRFFKVRIESTARIQIRSIELYYIPRKIR